MTGLVRTLNMQQDGDENIDEVKNSQPQGVFPLSTPPCKVYVDDGCFRLA